MANSGPSLSVRIGADTRDLETGLNRAKTLALYTSKEFERAFTSQTSTKTGQKQLNDEINTSIRLVGQMGRQINLRDQSAVSGLNQLIAEQRTWSSAVGATSEQMIKLEAVQHRLDVGRSRIEGQTRAFNSMTGELTAFGRRGISVFSGVLLAATQFGDGSGKALERVLGGASAIALAFGPTGAIVSALATGALAFVRYFSKARDEMEKTRAKFQEEVDKMVDTGGTGAQQALAQQLRTVLQGTPSHPEAGLDAKIARRDQLVRAGAGPTITYDRFGEERRTANAASTEVAKLNAEITELQRNAGILRQRLLNPPNYPTDLTGLRPVEIHGVDPFKIRKEKKERFPGYSPSPTLGDEVLRRFSERQNDIPPGLAAYLTPQSLAFDPYKGATNPHVGPSGLTAIDERAQKVLADRAAAELRVAEASKKFTSALQFAGSTLLSVATNLLITKIGGGGPGAAIGGGIGGAIGAALGSSLGPVGTAIGGLFGTGIGAGIGGLFDRHKKSVDSNAAALDRASKAAERLAASLSNIPTGFKVEGYRFRGSDPYKPPIPPPRTPGMPGPVGPTAPGDIPGTPGPVIPSIVITGDVYVVTNDPDKLWQKVGEGALRSSSRGGTSATDVAVNMLRNARAA